MAEKIGLDLDLNTKAAEASIEGLKKAFGALAGIAATVFAGKKFVGFLEEGIDAAVAQDKAMSQLGQSLRLTGEYSQGAMKHFSEFADAMEKTTKYGDDVILSQLSVAKSFGISNEKAEKLVTAATELSAATGQDLNTSVQALGKTFSGVTGKLDEQIPALKGMTKEALASGAAIDTVISRFGGSAAAEINTFSGAILQAKNAFGNFQESIGNLIVQNPVVIMLVKEFTEAFRELTGWVEGNSDVFRGALNKAIELAIRGFAGLTDVLRPVLQALRPIFEVMNLVAMGILQVGKAITSFQAVQSILKMTAMGFTTFAKTIVITLGAAAAGVDTLLEAVGVKSSYGAGFGAIVDKIDAIDKAIFDADIPGAFDKATDSVAAFGVAGVEAFGSADKSLEHTGRMARELADKVVATDKTQIQSAKDLGNARSAALANLPKDIFDQLSRIGTAMSDAIGAAISGSFSQIDTSGLSTAFGEVAKTFGAQITSSGQQSAKNIATGLAAALVDRVYPGLGSALKGIFDVFASGPDATKAWVRGFVDAVPEIITNLVESIPALIEGLIDSLVNRGGAVKIAIAIVSAMTGVTFWSYIGRRIGEELGLEFGNKFNGDQIIAKLQAGWERLSGLTNTQIIKGFTDGWDKISSRFGEMWDGMKKAFGEVFGGIIDAFKGIVSAFQMLVDAIPGAKGGGGTGGDGWIKGGGQKYDPGEWHMLTSSPAGGSASSVLSTFNSGSAPRSETTDALLLRVIALLEKPMIVTAQATLNNQVLADIMLDLNRRNARLTA